MLLIIIFGTMGLSNLRKTFFPERTSKLITVQAVYPGASPLEIEQMVTLKIEDNLDGITGIKRVTSKSSENTSNVTKCSPAIPFPIVCKPAVLIKPS